MCEYVYESSGERCKYKPGEKLCGYHSRGGKVVRDRVDELNRNVLALTECVQRQFVSLSVENRCFCQRFDDKIDEVIYLLNHLLVKDIKRNTAEVD